MVYLTSYLKDSTFHSFINTYRMNIPVTRHTQIIKYEGSYECVCVSVCGMIEREKERQRQKESPLVY